MEKEIQWPKEIQREPINFFRPGVPRHLDKQLVFDMAGGGILYRRYDPWKIDIGPAAAYGCLLGALQKPGAAGAMEAEEFASRLIELARSRGRYVGVPESSLPNLTINYMLENSWLTRWQEPMKRRSGGNALARTTILIVGPTTELLETIIGAQKTRESRRRQ